MKKEFSAYEFTGVIVPGSALLLGLGLIFVPIREFISSDKFDIGELGLFVIASYVSGHLIQSLGNLGSVFKIIFSQKLNKIPSR